MQRLWRRLAAGTKQALGCAGEPSEPPRKSAQIKAPASSPSSLQDGSRKSHDSFEQRRSKKMTAPCQSLQSHMASTPLVEHQRAPRHPSLFSEMLLCRLTSSGSARQLGRTVPAAKVPMIFIEIQIWAPSLSSLGMAPKVCSCRLRDSRRVSNRAFA